MTSKTATPRALFDALPSNVRNGTNSAAFDTLDAIGASGDTVPAITAVLDAARTWQDAHAALSAFDESVASAHELRTGSTRHDWSKPDPTRFDPDTRERGERLWHAERTARQAANVEESRLRDVLVQLLKSPAVRERAITELDRRGAEADVAFAAAVEQLDTLSGLIKASGVAAGVSLNLLSKQARREWQAVRDRQVIALRLGRESLAAAAASDTPAVDEPPRKASRVAAF